MNSTNDINIDRIRDSQPEMIGNALKEEYSFSLTLLLDDNIFKFLQDPRSFCSFLKSSIFSSGKCIKIIFAIWPKAQWHLNREKEITTIQKKNVIWNHVNFFIN
jgi:hypothetical protein